MNLDVELVGSWIGIVGLAFAATLSAIGYLYRGWVESKRSARRVLYLLLEIRYAILASLFDPSAATKEYIKHYTDRLKYKGLDVSQADIEKNIGQIVEEHFCAMAEAAKTDIEKRLLDPFEDALSDFSQTSPVLAYRLRGKEKLEVLAKLNSSYVSKFEHEALNEIEEEWAKQAIFEFSREVEQDALKKMSTHLDEEIIMLSNHCGWRESSECKKALSTSFGKLDDELYLELDKLIDKVVVKLTEASKKSI